MTKWWLDLAAALAVAWLACSTLGWLVPLGDGSFRQHLAGRLVRQLGRIAIVLLIVALGIRALDGAPSAITIGALGGWLAVAGPEAWRCRDEAGKTQERE